MVRNYYNYLTLDDEDINTAQAFYIICLNSESQIYKLVASPQALDTLLQDPVTRVAQYWPITREQIDNAPQNQIFDNNIRVRPFSLDEIQDCFGFNPQTIPPSEFGSPAPVQQQIPLLIQQAIQLAGLDADQLNYITKPECIAAIQEEIVTVEQLTEMAIDDLAHAVETGDYPRINNLEI